MFGRSMAAGHLLCLFAAVRALCMGYKVTCSSGPCAVYQGACLVLPTQRWTRHVTGTEGMPGAVDFQPVSASPTTPAVTAALYIYHLLRCSRAANPLQGANILVDKGSTVKLADFGASKKIVNLATVGAGCNSIRGTPYWMAPEVRRHGVA